MSNPLHFNGRVLFLSAQPELMRAQLEGRDLSLQAALPLRDDVSTDEITPVTVMMSYDSRLGRYPYVGLKCGEERPVATDAVRSGGFEITVAGKRYGKGSSREHSPAAERLAGIRLIIAESFERIYRQNCDNLGLYTSTDFSLLERIARGEAIELEELLRDRDALTQQVLRCGGLLAYSREYLGKATTPARSSRSNNAESASVGTANLGSANLESVNTGSTTESTDTGSAAPQIPPRPLTLVEKIIARHLAAQQPWPQPGEGVFLSADWRFSHDYFTGMTAHLMHQAFPAPVALERPEQIVVFEDHLVLAPQSHPHITGNLLSGVAELVAAQNRFREMYPAVRAHGVLDDMPGSEGICHAMMTERYALPGQVVVGTDSHTPHAGSLGALAFGAGATDIANSWATGFIRCKMPQVIRIELEGRLRPGVTAKDIVLHLLATDFIRSGQAIGAVFEYAGAAARALSIDERATLTNMVAELGGFTGIVAPDRRTVDFLRERRGVEFALEDWMQSDPGAHYQRTIEIDCSALTPVVARPGDPGNGVPLLELNERSHVDIAYGGSCTGGKREDFDFYHAVFQWGRERGLRVAPTTRLYLQFGTLAVRDYCVARGYLETFEAIGAELIMPGCGACANCGPGSSTRTDEVTVSAINRNFPGRSGPGSVWLASPFTVAASALSGRLTSFDELQRQHEAGAVHLL